MRQAPSGDLFGRHAVRDAMYLDGYRPQILAWIQQGLSDREIAEKVNVSPSAVRYWRERNGIARPPKKKKVDAGS